MQIDSGASCNVLPEKYVPLGTEIQHSKQSLTLYSKASLPVVGTCNLQIKNPRNALCYDFPFVIIKGDYMPLLGSQFVSDYMPFSSHEFGEFAKLYEFEKAPCSPEYPQSNGKAENAVKTGTLLMKKAKDVKTDFYLALLEWRNTPSAGLDSSPAQRMFGRRMRTLLPMSKQLLKPETQKGVSENDIVRIQPRKQDRWRKVIVLRKVDVPSYIVRREDGTVLRRN